jgi:probable DNA metabolism protein
MAGVYIYDGSFQGLLCVLDILLESADEPDDIGAEYRAFQESLLWEAVRVPTDDGRAEALSGLICERISTRALRHAYYAFLSEMEGLEYHVYRYLRLGWEQGSDVDARLGDEHVHAVHRMSGATGREAHRMRGFLRFRLLEDGLYYAPMEADCDVLGLVAQYFSARMGDQDWMIHDLTRKQVALHRVGELSFGMMAGFDPRFAEEEETCQRLWQRYFKAIAVADRRNSRLQKSCMPMKYWNILVEKPASWGNQ